MRTILLVTCALSAATCRSIGNDTAILISKYAKVAHWGASSSNATTPAADEARNSRGQFFWTHRSDANVISSQNARNGKPVAYQYAVYTKPESKLDEKQEDLPAKGEVIQDRFEPRPYFGHKHKHRPSASYNAPAVDAPPAAPSVPSPQASPDPYTSPYSSYNAPSAVTPDDSKDQYPPIGSSDDNPPGDSYAQPPPDASSGGMYDYKPADDSPKVPDSYPSVGPPFAPEYNEDQDAMPPGDSMPKGNGGGPPDHPPNSEDDVYFPPDDSGAMDHAPKPPKANNGGDMTMDLVPPPNDHGYPTYFYDQHGFDNHVYEEIPHSTPAPEMGDERVNKGHYSYYYLGRKLWYIPLYFSIYFIIYVTVLIFKSIARHKIQTKHNFVSHHSKRESRGMDLEEKIGEVHREVDTAITNSTKKYSDVVIM